MKRMHSPHLPEFPRAIVDAKPLAWTRDYMNNLAPHGETARAIQQLLDDWNRDRNATAPIQTIRHVLDSIRELPRGDERIAAMNTVVRTLGTATALATLLDMMRDSARRTGTQEQELSLYSRLDAKHSSYGWCGQTKLICSHPNPTPATLRPAPGVQGILGSVPATMWALSMHIWQPNPFAKGFPSGKRPEPNVIVEPPHSHPFEFASMVAIGSMHQSIYADAETAGSLSDASAEKAHGRYSGLTLERVTGVWPPHPDQESVGVTTLEERVLLSAGDSYYLPCNVIHDVEIDASVASTKPTITLFLRSECVLMPHVYMARSMLDFHADHPDIERWGQPMHDVDWLEKLRLVSEYLRGGRPQLVLDDVVKQRSEYSFFHS
jgi:hypothetical protein